MKQAATQRSAALVQNTMISSGIHQIPGLPVWAEPIAARSSEDNSEAPGIVDLRSSELLDTSEVRWFVPGPIPEDVLRWFADPSTRTAVEERCDTYLQYGIDWLGVKWRSGQALEIKRRHSIDNDLGLGQGLQAPLERWQKWPVELGPGWAAPDVDHIEVHKIVIKSSFALIDGVTVPTAPQNDPSTPGCSVELGLVVIDGVRSWTLALKASGPIAMRRHILLDSWRAVSDGSLPNVGLAVAASYPEWLERHLPYRLAG